METRKKFQALKKELRDLNNIQVNTCELTFYAPKKVREKAQEMGIPQQILSFYENSNGFELNWEMLSSPDPDVLGRVKILSLSEVIQDWKDVVYFEDTELDDPIRTFRPFDFFVDEACVGIFLEEEFDNSLYLYKFGSEPFRLDLDISGYIKLLIAARGFLYWQNVIEALKTESHNTEVERFRTFMPQIFPNFSFDEFSNNYENLRLSKI
ncbi:hypothetical protein H6G97_38160 [Nostoc flagelliforme FACHB-838]|uniref:Knr4/Smi1-like domain-containing protein n=1 Tax=Nostoc flagelliforme FACHB-838 TaxID=2692904 RepID=A0ABR8E066_9NOSO|nr:hypothetical protein [Nostoc flagelliforme]MBD2534949.1 hypothetical protein [Nostoc flagelliforme FACHB-838]